MFFTLLSHNWKKFWRAEQLGRSVLIRIFMLFGFLYFLLIGVALSYFFNDIASELSNRAPLQILNQYIFYFICGDIIIRYFFQDFAVPSLRNYLIHPIRRSTIFQIVFQRAILHPINLIEQAVILVLVWRTVLPVTGASEAILWYLTLSLTQISLNMAAFILQGISNKKFLSGLISLVALAGFIAMDYYNIFEVSLATLWVLNQSFLAVGMALIVAVTLIYYARNFLIENSYLDDLDAEAEVVGDHSSFKQLDRFGLEGAIIKNELRLIRRNKRTRIQFLLSLLVIPYMIYMVMMNGDSPFNYTFVSFFCLGIVFIFYLQFLWGYQAGFFEWIHTSGIKLKNYIRSVIKISIGAVFIFLIILTTIAIFLDYNLIPYLVVAAIYNIGVNIPFMLFMSNYNTKRIDMDSSGTFNSDGFSLTNFLIAIPLFLIPMLIVGGFLILDMVTIALAILAGLGIIGMALYPIVIRYIIKDLQQSKYKQVEAFRRND